jgi:hypothetical protein
MNIKMLGMSAAAAALIAVGGITQASTVDSVVVGSIADMDSATFSAGNVSGRATITVLSFTEAASNGGSPFRAVFEFFSGTTSLNSVDLTGPASGVTVGTFNFTGDEVTVTATGQGGASDFAVSVTSVPVPAAGLLLMGALGGIGLMRRRKTA